MAARLTAGTAAFLADMALDDDVLLPSSQVGNGAISRAPAMAATVEKLKPAMEEIDPALQYI